MKRIAFVGALLISSAAFAQSITTTLHNFNTNVNAQASDNQICKYCHTPHKANTTRALWNHTSNLAAYIWDVPTTIDGTTLTTVFAASQGSVQCLSCHDGTIALGSVYNAGGGSPGIVDFSGASVQEPADTLIGPNLVSPNPGARDLSGNHPVGIPYAGQVSYYGAASSAAIGVGGYRNHITGVVQGAAAGYTDIALSFDGTGYGVECGTCHNPHGTVNTYLLKAPTAASNICLSCHDK